MLKLMLKLKLKSKKMDEKDEEDCKMRGLLKNGGFSQHTSSLKCVYSGSFSYTRKHFTSLAMDVTFS